MSTKIYTAYMLTDKRKLWPVIRKIRERATALVSEALRKKYLELAMEAVREAERVQVESVQDPFKGYRDTYHSLSSFGASRYVKDRYVAQTGEAVRNSYDLTMSVAVREVSGGRIVLIPYPGSGFLSDALKFMQHMPELRDYHYQNQSDRSKHISARAWAERARTWGEALADKNWRNMLTLEIVSVDGFSWVDPAFKMASEQVCKANAAVETKSSSKRSKC
jgi:hypothetical protein